MDIARGTVQCIPSGRMVGRLFKTLQPRLKVSRAHCRVFAEARLDCRVIASSENDLERPGKARHLSSSNANTSPTQGETDTASDPEPTSRRLALTPLWLALTPASASLTPPLVPMRRQHGALLSLQDHRPVRSLPGHCCRAPPAAAHLDSFAPVHSLL